MDSHCSLFLSTTVLLLANACTSKSWNRVAKAKVRESAIHAVLQGYVRLLALSSSVSKSGLWPQSLT